MSGSSQFVPNNTFGSQIGPISLSTLDTNFNQVATFLNNPNNYSNYLADSGAANAYVVSFPTGITPTYTAGLTLFVKIANANTGASTINVSSLGAKNILNPDLSTLPANALLASDIVILTYDGTQFILIGGSGTGKFASITNSSLTSGRVPYSSTGGLQVDSANLLFNGTTLTVNTLNLTNGLVTSYGGTGLTSYTAGDLPYYASGTALNKLGIGTSGQILTSSGTAPQWSTLSGVAVTTFSAGTTGFTPNSATSGAITLAGTLATTNGGTGLTSFTANGIVYASSTSALATGTALTFSGTTLKTVASGNSSIAANNVTSEIEIQSVVNDGYINMNGTGAVIFRLGSGYAEQMRLTSTGLGIGTSSSISKLAVSADSVDGTQLRVIGKTNENYQIRFGFDTTNLLGKIQAIHVGTAYKDLVLQPDGGNLGLGVTPSASSLSGFIEGAYGTFGQTTSLGTSIAGNAYYNSGWKYKLLSTATLQLQDSGGFKWNLAASGTAGAAITFTQAMTLDASGKLGIGTTSPTQKLDVAGAIAVTASSGVVNPSYGVFGLYTGGLIPSTYIQMPSGGSIDFWKPDTGTAARIDSSGNLLVGTTSGTTYKAQFYTGDQYAFLAYNTNSAKALGDIWNSATTGDNKFFNFLTEAGGTQRGSITYNRAGGLTVYNTTSDYRAKDISGPVTNSGTLIDSVPVYMGKMKWATEERPMFIAHETPAYAHTGEKDAVDVDGNPVYQQMDASALIPVMWAEIQSLRKRLAAANIA